MPIQPGSKVGRYQIKAIIGRGGMAVVYKAVDTRLERDVAIKFIRMEQFGSNQWVNIRKRFEREALVMAKLDHPHIIKVFDYGEYEGTPYLVMQLVEGGSLKQRIGKPIPWQDAVQQIKPIAEALEYAHRQGIVHRDVKPGNILYTSEGNALLADFGIAKIVESTSGDSLTSSGVGMGTPEYMAPEQAMGKKIDQRADIYSLGVILYEMITGTRPFKADTPMEVVVKQTTEQLPRPSLYVKGLPGSVEAFLHTALAKNPADRQTDMAEFGRELAALAGGKAPEPRRAAAPARVVVPNRRERTVIEKTTAGERKKGVPKWILGGGIAIVVLLLVVFLSPPIIVPPPRSTQAAQWVKQEPTTAFPTALPTATILPTPTLGIGSSKISEKDGMKLLYVPAGEFSMGSNEGESDEKPAHTVYLDAFWIDQTEVTNAQYKLCVQAGACRAPTGNDYKNSDYAKHPVVNVDWNDAKTYCAWAGRQLPTEAQWEKAARGTNGRTYPWGEGIDCSRANYEDCNEFARTSPAGYYLSGASPYGALDMAGNVWEWVADWYGASYYSNSPTSNPTGPSSGTYRTLRGGSWGGYEGNLRASYRVRFGADLRNYFIGLRCATPSS